MTKWNQQVVEENADEKNERETKGEKVRCDDEDEESEKMRQS